jgi:hypothetical protein
VVATPCVRGWPRACTTSSWLGLPILALVFVATALIPVKPLRETNHDHPAEEAGVGVVESYGSTEAHDVDEVHAGR